MKILKFLMYMCISFIGWVICIVAFTMPTVAVTCIALVVLPIYGIVRMFDEE